MSESSREWPAWRFGPGGESRIFQENEPIPAGWVDHPSKVGQTPAPAALTGSESIPEVKAAFAEGRASLDEIEALESARQSPRAGVLDFIQTERARAEARAEGLTVLREAGVEISDDASDEELSAALDALEE